MKVLGIIPARFASTRFPGKPLVMINNKPMIQWVYESVVSCVDMAVVATDDERIYNQVLEFGGNVELTSIFHQTGTSRVAEAYEIIKNKIGEFDIIINVQGDEPLLKSQQLLQLINLFHSQDGVEMATLATFAESVNELITESEVFLVTDKNMDAIYFSRHPIPYIKSIPINEWLDHHQFKKHVGIYAFTPKALNKFNSLRMSELEKLEGLEQNRWLENGGKIRVALSDYKNISIDTPEDLEILLKNLNNQKD